MQRALEQSSEKLRLAERERVKETGAVQAEIDKIQSDIENLKKQVELKEKNPHYA